MATNIGHLYYKQYFNGLQLHRNTGQPKLDNPINKKLFNLPLDNYSGLIKTPYEQSSFPLTTLYPGLLIGSGYNHEVGGKEIENELKLGFYFDHTTGVPVIPGSSVKGMLRSAFKKANGDYIKEILEHLGIEYKREISELEKAIFENSEEVGVYNRDIFFDAYPLKSGNRTENVNTVFLANDYITHHENPLKNPNPVQFLKILPNVQFQFNFKLQNSGGLTAEQKKDLFKQILLDLGVGAKTNVGYGQFMLNKEENESGESYKKPSLAEIKQENAEKEANKTEAERRIVKGARLKCNVVEITNREVFFMFDWDKELKFTKKRMKLNVELKINNIIEIEIVEDFYVFRKVLFSNSVTIIQ